METDNLKPELEKTTNIYGLPVPENTKVHGLVYESRSHSGRNRGAIDIDVDLDTPILSPLEGMVVQVVDSNDKQGPTAEFAKYNNYIFIQHVNGEYSKISHMPKDSSLVKVGEQVKEGQQIARCGFVGATTKPHIHWVVYVKDDQNQLQSRKIQLKKSFKTAKDNAWENEDRADAKEFYEITKDIPPSKMLAEAVELAGHPGSALDLGCGAGRDTKYLLEQGLTVTAVDRDSQTQHYLSNLPQDHLNIVISNFEGFQFDHYDLINAHNSLPFTNKNQFPAVMQRLKDSINPGGVFVGTLFGNLDEWNTPDSQMSFVTNAQAKDLFKDFKMVKFEERNYDGSLANGTPKHWHIFYIIVQK